MSEQSRKLRAQLREQARHGRKALLDLLGGANNIPRSLVQKNLDQIIKGTADAYAFWLAEVVQEQIADRIEGAFSSEGFESALAVHYLPNGKTNLVDWLAADVELLRHLAIFFLVPADLMKQNITARAKVFAEKYNALLTEMVFTKLAPRLKAERPRPVVVHEQARTGTRG